MEKAEPTAAMKYERHMQEQLNALAARNAELLAALRAQDDAEKADDDALELVERADGEGWLYEPTGSSHINDAYKRATELQEKARDLRRAAIAKAEQLGAEGENRT